MDQPHNTGGTRAPAVEQPPPPASALNAQNDRAQSAPLPPEKDLWSGRMHWQNAVGRVFLWFILSIALIAGAYYVPKPAWLTQTRLVWGVLAFIAVSALVLLGGVFVRILQTHYRLSTQRLFIEKGILSRTMDQTELIRVDDVRMHQSLTNRIFNVGTILLMTTDVTDRSVAIVGVKDPVRVCELVRQQMRTLRGKSLFVENL